MTQALQRHWFLVALLILIPTGVGLGFTDNSAADRFSESLDPRWITASALFLMAFTLDSSQLRKSLASPGPVVLAVAVNFVFIPLLALAIAPLQLSRDFQYGLLIAASSPCTMAAASVWTRQAEGNDAVSLLVTFVTNGICVVVTPFWIELGTDAEVELGFTKMVLRLLLAVLIPGAIGQLLRVPASLRRFATERKKRISIVAMSCILLLVLASSIECGSQLDSGGPAPSITAVGFVWACCIGIHLTAMFVAWRTSKLLGMTDFDRPAIAFASSQKTLPIGVMMARELAVVAAVPFAVFPMLMYHASQLIIDTAIAPRIRPQADESGEPESG